MAMQRVILRLGLVLGLATLFGAEHANSLEDHSDHDHDHHHEASLQAAEALHHQEPDDDHEAHGHHHHDHDNGHKDDHHDAHGHDEHDHSSGHKDHHHDDGLRDELIFKAYVSALAMSAISFIGVALLVFLNIPSLGVVVEYSCLAFAGTVLVADALVHLLPHALEGADHDTMLWVGLAATAGCLAILAVPEICEWHQHSHQKECDRGEGHHVEAYGVANLVTEMLHNFVDGISLGLAWISGPSAGVSAAIAVAVHELPQELGDFMVLRSAGFPVGRLLLWNFLVSLTCTAGVGLVHCLGKTAMAAAVQRYMTAFTAGSFLSLSLNMIFPQVFDSIRKYHKGAAAGRAKLLCCALGALAIYSLVKIGDLEGDAHDHGHAHGTSHGHGHGHGEL